jgi:hypothetical protein
VNPEIEHLLALQECDMELDRLDGLARGLDAREQDMNRQRATLADAVARAREQLTSEQERERELERAAREHRDLQDKFASQMDAVRKAKEAVAATTQLELAQRVVATDEQQLQSVHGRVRDLQQAAELHEMELAEVDERQKTDREALAAERASLDDEVAVSRARRTDRARVVSRSLLNRYDRLRTRGHIAVLVPLEGSSCTSCRTAVPMQVRNEILAGRRVETCEGCGVLLYASG